MAHNIEKQKRTKDIFTEVDVFFENDTLIDPEIRKGLFEHGFIKESPIQIAAFPYVLNGYDVIVQSKSGTGKSLVFIIAAMCKYMKLPVMKPQTIILVPTREIAVQITEIIKQIGVHVQNLFTDYFIGGTLIDKDKCNVQIVVGSPGRVKHLINSNYLNVSSVRLFILDEADKMISSQLEEEVTWIYGKLPEMKQMLVVSATYTPMSLEKLKCYMIDPILIRPEDANKPLLGVKQMVCLITGHKNPKFKSIEEDKQLLSLLSNTPFNQCVIFTNYQMRADVISEKLNNANFKSVFLTGAMTQESRLESLNSFKGRKVRILVSTDLAARGIDAANVDLVINMEIPHDKATYLHRMGRAGRYGSRGLVITIVSEDLLVKFNTLVQTINIGSSFKVGLVPKDLNCKNLWTHKVETILEKRFEENEKVDTDAIYQNGNSDIFPESNPNIASAAHLASNAVQNNDNAVTNAANLPSNAVQNKDNVAEKQVDGTNSQDHNDGNTKNSNVGKEKIKRMRNKAKKNSNINNENEITETGATNPSENGTSKPVLKEINKNRKRYENKDSHKFNAKTTSEDTKNPKPKTNKTVLNNTTFDQTSIKENVSKTNKKTNHNEENCTECNRKDCNRTYTVQNDKTTKKTEQKIDWVKLEAEIKDKLNEIFDGIEETANGTDAENKDEANIENLIPTDLIQNIEDVLEFDDLKLNELKKKLEHNDTSVIHDWIVNKHNNISALYKTECSIPNGTDKAIVNEVRELRCYDTINMFSPCQNTLNKYDIESNENSLLDKTKDELSNNTPRRSQISNRKSTSNQNGGRDLVCYDEIDIFSPEQENLNDYEVDYNNQDDDMDISSEFEQHSKEVGYAEQNESYEEPRKIIKINKQKLTTKKLFNNDNKVAANHDNDSSAKNMNECYKNNLSKYDFNILNDKDTVFVPNSSDDNDDEHNKSGDVIDNNINYMTSSSLSSSNIDLHYDDNEEETTIEEGDKENADMFDTSNYKIWRKKLELNNVSTNVIVSDDDEFDQSDMIKTPDKITIKRNFQKNNQILYKKILDKQLKRSKQHYDGNDRIDPLQGTSSNHVDSNFNNFSSNLKNQKHKYNPKHKVKEYLNGLRDTSYDSISNSDIYTSSPRTRKNNRTKSPNVLNKKAYDQYLFEDDTHFEGPEHMHREPVDSITKSPKFMAELAYRELVEKRDIDGRQINNSYGSGEYLNIIDGEDYLEEAVGGHVNEDYNTDKRHKRSSKYHNGNNTKKDYDDWNKSKNGDFYLNPNYENHDEEEYYDENCLEEFDYDEVNSSSSYKSMMNPHNVSTSFESCNDNTFIENGSRNMKKNKYRTKMNESVEESNAGEAPMIGAWEPVTLKTKNCAEIEVFSKGTGINTDFDTSELMNEQNTKTSRSKQKKSNKLYKKASSKKDCSNYYNNYDAINNNEEYARRNELLSKSNEYFSKSNKYLMASNKELYNKYKNHTSGNIDCHRYDFGHYRQNSNKHEKRIKNNGLYRKNLNELNGTLSDSTKHSSSTISNCSSSTGYLEPIQPATEREREARETFERSANNDYEWAGKVYHKAAKRNFKCYNEKQYKDLLKLYSMYYPGLNIELLNYNVRKQQEYIRNYQLQIQAYVNISKNIRMYSNIFK